MSELLIGCGSNWNKQIWPPDKQEWSDLTTLDNNADHKPDVIHDLNTHPLPFEDNRFDEIHAYEVLEHLASQGDYRFFFSEWSEYWRILKPGGTFFGKVPAPDSPWAYGDPSHTRIIPMESFIFLSQKAYRDQVGKTAMSDFRYLYQADFELIYQERCGDSNSFALKAIK